MDDSKPENQKPGVSRRVFINRSLATAGGAVMLTNAGSWPAWADSAAYEGTFTRMGRIVRDREWKYAYYFSPHHDGVKRELYNLKDNPLEMDNLAQDTGYKARIKEMHERLFERERELEQEFELP